MHNLISLIMCLIYFCSVVACAKELPFIFYLQKQHFSYQKHPSAVCRFSQKGILMAEMQVV